MPNFNVQYPLSYNIQLTIKFNHEFELKNFNCFGMKNRCKVLIRDQEGKRGINAHSYFWNMTKMPLFLNKFIQNTLRNIFCNVVI